MCIKIVTNICEKIFTFWHINQIFFAIIALNFNYYTLIYAQKKKNK